jgi:CRP-like cAMP-binding protein
MEELMMSNPAFGLRVAQTVSRVATRSLNYFLMQNMKNVRGKLAEMLLHLSGEIFRSGSFDLSFTRREMADFVGTTTETTIRVLNEFRRDGLIRIDQRIVTILDGKRLEMLSKKG